MRWRWFDRRVRLLLSGVLVAAAIATFGSLRAQELAPGELLHQGEHFFEEGRYDAAADALQAASQAFAAAGDRQQQIVAAINLALIYQHLNQWPEALASLESGRQLLAAEPSLSEAGYLQARLWEIQGQIELSRGQAAAALETWRQASRTYAAARRGGDRYRSELLQNQALQQLGHYRDALQHLTTLEPPLSTMTAPYRAEGLRQLGRVVRVVGDLPGLEDYWSQFGSELASADYLDKAAWLLHQSEAAFAKLQLAPEQAAALLDWAAVEQARYFRARDLADRSSYGFRPKESQISDQVKPLQEARQLYQRVQQIAPTPLVRLQAQLQEFDLALEVRRRQAGDWAELSSGDRAALAWAAQTLPVAAVAGELAALPDSRATIYAELKLAKLAIASQELGQSFAAVSPDWVAMVLERAGRRAERLGDRHALSYARGYLGRWHELRQDWAAARDLTAAASLLAEGLNSPELNYEWAWQLGRILAAQHQHEAAIAAYETAVKHLDELRAQLLGAGNPDFKFLFRDRVEPVYRELLALLLPPEVATGKQQLPDGLAQPSEARLQRARAVVQELQVAELEDFLRCQLPGQTPLALDRYVDRGDRTTAVIYPIAIGDRLGLIAKLPQQPLIYRASRAPDAVKQLESTILELRDAIEDAPQVAEVQAPLGKAYQLLIEPLESALEASSAESLVFVLDSAFRNLPLAALYDAKRQEYLLERYNLAINLGLEFPARSRVPLAQASILAAGVSEENCLEDGECAKPLPAVVDELKAIYTQWPQAQVLQEAQFTEEALRERLEQQAFQVVHLATHGEFTSDPKTTSILAYQQAIDLNELSAMLQVRRDRQPEPLDLLVLSACETAVGDRRATLGMAGVAVQAGASSTLASLFQVSDPATAELTAHFYRYLAQPNTSKAAALRQAQLELLRGEYAEPQYWSPYVLIGNWR